MEAVETFEIVDGPDSSMMRQPEWQLWLRPQGDSRTILVHAELERSVGELFSGRIAPARLRREEVEWIEGVTCTYRPKDGSLVKGILQGPPGLRKKLFPTRTPPLRVVRR